MNGMLYQDIEILESNIEISKPYLTEQPIGLNEIV